MTQAGEKRLIDKIVQMAETEVAQIISEAENEAEEFKKETVQKAASEAQDIINRGTQEAKREKQRIIADARLKAKRKKMSMQEQLMKESFEKATTYLQELFTKGKDAEYDYTIIMTSFIKEAAEIIGGHSLQLSFNEKDKKNFEPLLPRISENVSQALGRNVTLTVSDKTISTLGGVNVKGEDGMVGVDNTIESRLSRFNEQLKAEVTKTLL